MSQWPILDLYKKEKYHQRKKKLDMRKYKKNMSCFLEKGENTNENRDATSSDLGKKMISSDLLISFIWKEWRKQRYHKNNYRSEEVRQIEKEKSEDEEVLCAREKNRENRKIEKKLKSLLWVRKTWEEEREREREREEKKMLTGKRSGSWEEKSER